MQGKAGRSVVSILNVRFAADIVAKVFLGWRTKILRAAEAFYARRREGPYRFIQNRSLTSIGALKSDAAAEKSKDQLSRDFSGCWIFDFCNNIRHKRPLASLLDHFVGDGKQVLGYVDAKRFCSLELDHQIELCRLHHRHFRGVGALEVLRPPGGTCRQCSFHG
jgi:hypothetical protein